MGQITVSVNKQTYTLACRDGEEERLAELVEQVDSKAMDLAAKLGHVGEARLMLMTALLLADELRDLREQGAAVEMEKEAVKVMEEANSSIKGIVERLAHA